MASRTVLLPAAVLILRLLALGLLIASLAVIAADKLSVVDSDDPSQSQKYTFRVRDFYAYRYVLAVAVIGCAYTVLELPLAAVSVARGNKRAVGGGSVAVALVVVLAEVVFALLLATGAAAGFGFTLDVKHYLDGQLDDFVRTPEVDEFRREMDRFFELSFASAGLMLAAAACMTLVIMLSVCSLAK